MSRTLFGNAPLHTQIVTKCSIALALFNSRQNNAFKVLAVVIIESNRCMYSVAPGKHVYESIYSKTEVYRAVHFLLGSASCQAVETERGFLFNLQGLFLQSVGFPFDSQGPGSTRNVLLHF